MSIKWTRVQLEPCHVKEAAAMPSKTSPNAASSAWNGRALRRAASAAPDQRMPAPIQT